MKQIIIFGIDTHSLNFHMYKRYIVTRFIEGSTEEPSWSILRYTVQSFNYTELRM